MNNALLLLAATFATSAVLTRLMRSLAHRCGAVDGPDGRRKLQTIAVPVWGGAAVYLTMLLGLALAWPTLAGGSDGLDRWLPAMAVSATLVVLLGLFDDWLDVAARKKLLLQVMAVVPLVASGFTCEEVAVMGRSFDLGWAGLPLTIFWLVGCINAMNLLDGMDGNASVVGLLATGAIGVIAARHGHHDVVLVAAILAGGILGFLVYNLPLPTATIYLGDSGSTLIGLILGVLCLEGARHPTGEVRIAVPLVTMTIPILDSTLAIVRRKLTGRRFDSADRGHLHHRLLQHGLNSWSALGIVALLCGISGGAAILATSFDSEPLAWLSSLVLIGTLVQTGYFGHYELTLLRKRSSSWLAALATLVARFRSGPTHFPLPAGDFDQAWDALTRELPRWQAERLELNVHDGYGLRPIHIWHATEPSTRGHHWRLALSFGEHGMGSCELVVSGQDRRTSEPWYLEHLSELLRAYGRAWTTKSAAVTSANSSRAVSQVAASHDGLRDAA